MASTSTRSSTVCRVELLINQLAWALGRRAPGRGSRGRKAVRAALDRGVFEALTFYASNSGGVCLAVLELRLERDRHRQLVLLHPSVRIDKHWDEQVAPDLRQVVENFEDVVARCGLTVTARLRVEKGARLEVDGKALPRASPPAGGLTFAATVSRLDELHMNFILAADLAEAAPRSP